VSGRGGWVGGRGAEVATRGVRGWVVALLVGVLAVAGVARPAAAQATVADTAAVLLDVARQLEAEGELGLARALYERIAKRYAGTPAADRVASRLAALRGVGESRGGRTELLAWSTLYGLWLGVAVPASLGADEVTPYGMGLIVGGPAGFLAARRYLQDRPLTLGQARAITFGGMWGTWQALGWREVLGVGEREHRICYPDPVGGGQVCTIDEETPGEAVYAAAVLGGLAGIGVGAVLANRGPISDDVATVVNHGALWGTWYGAVLGMLLDLDSDGLLTSMLIGGNVGLVGSAMAAPDWNVSRSRARLISVAGVAGLVAGLGLDLLIEPRNERMAIVAPAAGSAAGLLLGAHWTRGHDGGGSGEGGEGPGAGALLDLRDGRVAVGIPFPTPTMVPADRAGARRAPGARWTLFQATF